MAGIDAVLERLVADGDFRVALARDPAAALAGYDLTRADVELLASRLDDGDDAERAVEQRTSKSAMLSFLAAFADPGGGGGGAPAGGHHDEIEVTSWSWGQADDGGGGTLPEDVAVPGGDDEAASDMLLKIGGVKGEAEDAVASGPDELATAEATDEAYNKSRGKVEYSWKIEEGVKAEIEPDDLTHKVDPGDGADAIGETPPFNHGKIEVDPAAADADGSAGNPPDDSAPAVADQVDATSWSWQEGEQSAPVDADEQGIIVINGQEEQLGATPPDDGVVGSTPPDDNVVGVVGGIPPDDGIVGGVPPDDSLESDIGQKIQVELSTRNETELAGIEDDVLGIEDA